MVHREPHRAICAPPDDEMHFTRMKANPCIFDTKGKSVCVYSAPKKSKTSSPSYSILLLCLCEAGLA